MAKEDKKEATKINENKDENSFDAGILGMIIPLLTSTFNSPTVSEFEVKQLKELYHSLDKRLAVLESNQQKKKFLFF